MRTVRDTWLIFRRSLVLTIRQPVWIVFGIMYPVLYLVLFGPLLNGAVAQAGAGVSTYNWFVPGLLVQVALFGTAFGGWRIVRTMGMKITELKPYGGFCAETGVAFTLFLATHLGVPVSTTHTITGAIVGVGATRGASAVKWGLAGRIVWAWILTIPAAAIVAAGTYMLTTVFHAR